MNDAKRLVLGFAARDPDGKIIVAQIIEGDAGTRTERRFRWSKRTGYVTQWVYMPVSNSLGYGDGYWRRAGRRDSERVMKLLERTMQQGRIA